MANLEKMIEIRWHGRGGQGAVTSAEILAEAAISEGKYAQAFPSFGPERRGAPVLAFVRISANQPIRIRSSITEPDVLKPRCKPSADICCPVDVNIGEVLASIFVGAEKNLQDYLKNYTIQSVMDDIRSRGPRDCGCGNSIF